MIFPRESGYTVLALILALSLPVTAYSACTLDQSTGTTIDAEPYLKNAYNGRWNAAADRLAFMEPGADGHYRVFTQKPDGTDRIDISGGKALLPPGHRGPTYWHPSGRYLLLTAQKPDWTGKEHFGVPDYEAIPGYGRHNDLWLSTADGRQTWQLTHDENTKDQGILIPIFAPDGKHVAWSARQPGGKYLLTVADFDDKPAPHLSNLKTFQPGGPAYYETGSFSSDSKSLFYTSDHDTHSFFQSQIYRLDLATGKTTRLTQGKDYNEHPSIVHAPKGDWVVYMSTKDVKRFPWKLRLGTDWWAMRPDGSALKRLTYMNTGSDKNPENTGEPLIAGTVAASPAGDMLLGDVQDSLTKQTGTVKVIRLVCP